MINELDLSSIEKEIAAQGGWWPVVKMFSSLVYFYSINQLILTNEVAFQTHFFYTHR